MLINSTATPVSINIMRILVVTCALLTIPLFAMQFTNEVNWSIADFLVMGGMLFTASLLATYAYQRLPFQLKKIAVIAVITAFVTLWALLAVGL